MPHARQVTIPDPRCPFCETRMEEVQLKMEAAPWHPDVAIPHEVWQCRSCKTNHIFPARREFLEYVGRSDLLPLLSRVVHLPV